MKKVRHNGDDTAGAAFKERMVAQVEQIELYRLAVMREEGRCLSRDQAAIEWIRHYADAFARDHDYH